MGKTMMTIICVLVVLVVFLVGGFIILLSEIKDGEEEPRGNHSYDWEDVKMLGLRGVLNIPLPPMKRNGRQTEAAFVIIPGKGCYLSLLEGDRWYTKEQWIGAGHPSFAEGNSILPSIKSRWEALADKD